MTLEEKLRRVRDDLDGMYNAGADIGYTTGHRHGKEEGFGEGYNSGRKDGEDYAYPLGVEDGKQAEYDRFWDAAQDYGKRTSYAYGFGSRTWTDVNFKPKYDIKPIGTATSIFRYLQVADFVSILEEQGVELDTSGAENLEYCFQYSTTKTIGVIDCTGLSDSLVLRSSFSGMPNLETIELLRVTEKTQFKATFSNSPKIKSLRVEGVIGQNDFNVQWSPLDHESLMSIIYALQDKTGDTSGTSWVITLGTANLAKLSDAEKAIATQKGWSLL